jgi:N-acetylmuramoyl-L-alanine amidase
MDSFARVWIALAAAGLCMASGLPARAQAPAPAACDPAKFVLLLDVGHIPQRPGAISARGVPELEFNLALTKRILQQLQEAGFKRAQMMVRERGTLMQRAAAMNAINPDLILSIHHDSMQPHYLKQAPLEGVMRTWSDRFSGYSIFVSYLNPQRERSERFAKLLGDELVGRGHHFTMHHAEKIKGENRPVLDGKVGVFRYDRLIVLRETTAPAVLFEAAVILNPHDETRASTPAFRSEIAASVVGAAQRYCDQVPAIVARP